MVPVVAVRVGGGEEVGERFAEDVMSVAPQSKAILNFCDYLVDNCISEDAKYSPQMWASFDSSLSRTTNANQSLHSKLKKKKKKLYSPHPDLFKFFSVLQEMQTDTDIMINSVHKSKRIIVDKKNAFVEKQVERYTNKSIKRSKFFNNLLQECSGQVYLKTTILTLLHFSASQSLISAPVQIKIKKN